MDSEDDLEWEEWDSSRISFGKHMIAGSIAGLSEHISTFPVVRAINIYLTVNICCY